jgi:hypothetical protein
MAGAFAFFILNQASLSPKKFFPYKYAHLYLAFDFEKWGVIFFGRHILGKLLKGSFWRGVGGVGETNEL